MHDGKPVLQDVMRAPGTFELISREESTKYTEEWDLSLPWRTEARTDISRQVPRSLVPEGVEGRVAYKGSC